MRVMRSLWCCSPPPAVRGSTSAPRCVRGTEVELRLLGTNPGDYQRGDGRGAQSCKVTAGGQTLKVEPAQPHIDLGNQQQAWLIGAVRVPDGVQRLDVRLRLDDFGGFRRTPAAPAKSTRCSLIAFSTGFDRTKAVPQSTVILDLQRSLARTRSDARLLLPQVSIAY